MARDTDDDFLNDGPAPTGAETRTMLRNVGAYRTVVGHVRSSALWSFAFGALFIGIWYSLPAKEQFALFGLLYLGLGVLEFTVGLLNLAKPSLEGILFDGIVLVVFGIQSAARHLLIGGGVSPWLLLSGYWVYSGFQRCRNYFQIRRAFPVRPTSANLKWFDDLIRDVRKADPANDPTALDLATTPPLRAKLIGDSAFLIASGTNDLIILAADEFDLDEVQAGDGPTRASLRLEGVSGKPFPLDADNWRNYHEWKRANGQ